MARPRLALAALLVLAGCASTAPRPNHDDGPLAGSWLLTVFPVQPRGTGDLRTVLTFEPHGTGFEAHSRPGAVRDLVGGFKATLASIAGGEAFARGALVHIYDGRVVPAGDSVAVAGRLVAQGFRPLALTGTLADGRLRGMLRGPSGDVVARVEAVPYAGTLPVADYAAVASAARAAVAERFYDPRELATPAWTAFWADAGRRLGRAQDDLEALSQFRLAAAPLALSHFWIQRAAPRPPEALSGDGLSFARRPDGVAVLTCLVFDAAQATPVLDAAFAEMQRDPPAALVVDLRACSGGDLSAMLVAAHLVAEPAAAGLFLSNRWWSSHDAPPPREAWASLPVLSSPDPDAFFRILAETGALVGRVEPVAPTYRGPVYVLTGPGSASAAEPLAHLLQATGRATLVGAPTAGAMLSSTVVSLDDGWELVVPAADYVTAEGERLEGHGVVPTVAVDPAQAMERALALAR